VLCYDTLWLEYGFCHQGGKAGEKNLRTLNPRKGSAMNSKQYWLIGWLMISLLVMLSNCSNYIIKPPPYTPFHDTPSFSPDGKTIAFFSWGNEASEIGLYLLDIKSGQTSFLVASWGSPDWSPTDSIIVYQGLDDQIYSIHLSTHHISQLTTQEGNYNPNFSPDGNRIAYDSNWKDPAGASAIWLMDSDGGNKTDISVHGTGEWRDPCWSPDGKKIIHFRYIGTVTSEIFEMDSIGNNEGRLTSNDKQDTAPASSPEGTMIAWCSSALGNGYPDIWLMNTDGTDQKCFIRRAKNPDWSPDSQKLIFVAPDGKGKEVIWIINKDGSDKKQLTF
jgi:Tol biopolymer transport system component